MRLHQTKTAASGAWQILKFERNVLLWNFFITVVSKKVSFMNLINVYICVVVAKDREVDEWVKESDLNTDTVTQWIVMGTTVCGEGTRKCADTWGRVNVRKSMVMKMQFRYQVVNDVGVNKPSWQWRSTGRPFKSCLWAQFC